MQAARSCSPVAIRSTRRCAPICPRPNSSSRPTRGCTWPRGSACTSTASSAISTPPTRIWSKPPIAAGAVIERHPAEKDATDLELAIDTAVRAGARSASSSSAAEAGASTTCSPTCCCSRRPRGRHRDRGALRSRACTWCTAAAGRARSTGAPGSLVTLLPVGGAGARRRHRRACSTRSRTRTSRPAPRAASATC